MKIASRQFRFGRHTLTSREADPGAAPYILAGRHMYALGYGSAELGPIGAEHLVGQMGGIWAHPLRLADGLALDLLAADGAPLPVDPAAFYEQPGAVAWSWRSAGLRAERHDTVLPAEPAYRLSISLTNQADRPASGALRLSAPLAFQGAWFGGLASDGGAFQLQGHLLVGQDGLQPGWGLALGCPEPPGDCALTPRERGALAELRYAFQLAPGASRSWSFLLVAAHLGGGQAAAERWLQLQDTHPAPAVSRAVPATPSETSSPSLELTSPPAVSGSNAPVSGSNAPVPGSNAPVSGSHAPVSGSNAPVSGSNAPVPGSNAPVPGSNAPVPGSQPAEPASPTPNPQPPAPSPQPPTPNPQPPTPDSQPSDLELHHALARANLELLRVDYPDLGEYFLAGLPEYPQLFGCDTAYSVAGATAAGFGPTMRAALSTLAAYAERACGRVPHELTTSGRVFHPGNIQETPQLTIAVWDYLRWSGDLAFARELFPLLREGMLDLLPASCGHGKPYPYGDGMVERLGMGSRKLDSACYAIAGLRALAQIAAALRLAEAATYAARAEAIRAEFEQDWWLESEGLYADSMHSDGSLQLDGHWTVALPVQLGIAAPARARRVLDRVEAEFVNEWGLVHTRGREELVWTLPTGLLALALFAHGRAEPGLRLTENIARTAHYGTLGSFKELIPQGLCFIQLWSAGLYLQAIYEGLLGLQPDAPAHRLGLAPCLPAGHPALSLRGLRVGPHLIDISVAPGGLQLDHRAGPQPLRLCYAGAEVALAPGERFERGEGRPSERR